MSTLMPSPIAEFLGRKEKFSIIRHQIPKKATVEGLDTLRDIVSDIVLEDIISHYHNIGLNINPSLFNFLLEPLKNANCHSTSDKDIAFRIMMSRRGIVASYNDGGEYFKREDVKTCYENRVYHPEKHQSNIYGIGYGVGTQLMYSIADLIYVDKEKNTLYIGISLDKIVLK
jgi:hypothetical protein